MISSPLTVFFFFFLEILIISASFWSAVQTATGVEEMNLSTDESQTLPPASLGSVSVLLLLNLACHQCSEGKDNAYKDALSEFQNAQGAVRFF